METFESLKGRVAIVTGATSGIGQASAVRLGAVGMNVVLADYNEKNAENVVNKIKEVGGDAIFVKCDVSKEDDVKNVVNKAVKKYGKLNVVVNCAGVSTSVVPLHELEVAEFDKVLSINLKGSFMMMKYGVEAMVKTKAENCSIVNLSSVSGVVASSGATAYTTSKFGVVGLTKSGAVDYAKHNITVNAICPYVVRTGLLKNVPAEIVKEYEAACANGRIAEPDEIGGLILFLVSDMARYINGATLAADAGKTAGDIIPLQWKEI